MRYKPMLASLGDESYLRKSEYIFEPKLDGYRALCEKRKGRLRFVSRNGIDISSKYPELQEIKENIKEDCILDGEIVIYNKKGIPDFNLLQRRELEKEGPKANYIVFDILEANGKDVTSKKLLQRRVIFEKLVSEKGRLAISVSTRDGKALCEEMKKREMEGVMAKREESKYVQKRSKDWIKIKFTKTIECVILGYTSEKRKISSLALGLYDDDRLIYIGKVGTGFSESTIDMLKDTLEDIKYSPVEHKDKNIQWVKPEHVAEISYHEMTSSNALRAPSFIGVRKDKKPQECTLRDQE